MAIRDHFFHSEIYREFLFSSSSSFLIRKKDIYMWNLNILFLVML